MADAPARPDLITLPHHAEFLSDRWLDEAGRFWREVAAPRLGKLAGGFSISERFSEAPPHLKLPGDVAAWTLRVGRDGAHLERGFAEDADVTV